MKAANSAAARAAAAWGEDVPDWVAALAQAADTTSQARAAHRIGYSAAVVSLVLAGRYPGDLEKVETAVRAHLMAGTVACPELGSLPLADCLEWRRKAAAFAATSSRRLLMYRACRACAHNPGGNHAE